MTLAGLAEELGVNPSTVSRWRTDLALDIHAALEVCQGLFEHLPEVCEALTSKAEEGSYEHIELFLKVVGLRDRPGSITENRRVDPPELGGCP